MIRAALEEIDLSAVMAAVVSQHEHGHTADSDAELPLCTFGDKMVTASHEAADVIRDGDRQNLDVAYRRCARMAAMCLASMRRIRREQGQRP